MGKALPVWRIEILSSAVAAELEAFPVELRASLQRIIDRVELVGLAQLREPFVKHLTGKLWELRPTGRDVTGRVLYVTQSQYRLVIVAAFVKKTEKTPRRFIELALLRAKEIV